MLIFSRLRGLFSAIVSLYSLNTNTPAVVRNHHTQRLSHHHLSFFLVSQSDASTYFINTVSACLPCLRYILPPSGKHRAGWGLDEPCEDFLKDYNKIKEVKKTTKKHIEHGPDSDKPRLFGVAHVKDYEDLVGLE